MSGSENDGVGEEDENSGSEDDGVDEEDRRMIVDTPFRDGPCVRWLSVGVL